MKKSIKLSNAMFKLDNKLKDDIKDGLSAYGINENECEVMRKSSSIKDNGEIEEEQRTVTKYVSTRDVDETGDIIDPKGIDFKQFVASGAPVFFGHNYSIPQVATDEWIKADSYGLKVKQRYATLHEGSFPDVLWKLTKQGMNTQSSVGIIPLRSVTKDNAEFKALLKEYMVKWPELKSTAKKCTRIITKALLFEHSDVSLAANPHTNVLDVSKMFSEAGADEVLLKQLGLPILEVKVEDNDAGSEDENREEVTEDVVGITDKSLEGLELVAEKRDEELVESIKVAIENKTDITLKGDTGTVEPKVEPVKEKPKVTMVKEAYHVKLVKGPDFDTSIIKNSVKDEIRKRLGRLI